MTIKRRKNSAIAEHHEAPDWMVDNHSLITGYRINHTFLDTMKSIFKQHNDLLNIWTHLIGMLIFLGLIIYLFLHRAESIQIYSELKQDFQNLHLAENFQ